MRKLTLLILILLLSGGILFQCASIRVPRKAIDERHLTIDTVFGPAGNILYIKKHHGEKSGNEVYLYSTLVFVILIALIFLYEKK